MDKFDGGGSFFKLDFTQRVRELVKERGEPFNQCLEWCAGLGEIGRDLLKHNLIKKLMLLDINKTALDEGAKRWGRKNIRYRQSNNLSGLSKHEKFDLVVGNPPSYRNVNHNHPSYPLFKGDLRPFDDDWKLRKGFYKNIAKHMIAGGIVLVLEVELYKSKVFIVDTKEPWDDRPKPPVREITNMVEGGGLQIESCFFIRNVYGVDVFIMESKNRRGTDENTART